jgi:hypothetical protein
MTNYGNADKFTNRWFAFVLISGDPRCSGNTNPSDGVPNRAR